MNNLDVIQIVSKMDSQSTLTLDLVDMKAEGMQPIDCLYYATSSGMEYPDAVYLVSRIFKLDNDEVSDLEAAYN
jgi:hypothetical protein